jgi:hypothetical protein
MENIALRLAKFGYFVMNQSSERQHDQKHIFTWVHNIKKYHNLAQFANFVYVRITCGNYYHFWLKNGNNFCT